MKTIIVGGGVTGAALGVVALVRLPVAAGVRAPGGLSGVARGVRQPPQGRPGFRRPAGSASPELSMVSGGLPGAVLGLILPFAAVVASSGSAGVASTSAVGAA